jgi:integrase/recombinase XerD
MNRNIHFIKERFIEDAKKKNLSAGTIKQLDMGLSFVIRFLSGKCGLTDVREIKEEDVTAFARYVKAEYKSAAGKELCPRRKQFLVYMLARFCSFLEREEYILINPARLLEFEKPGKTLPKDILTEEETEKLLSAPNLKRPSGIRDRAVLEILYGSGLRNEEVRNLRFHDLDLDSRYLCVRGKGSKDRVVPITVIAKKFLNNYLEKVRPFFCKSGASDIVFLTQSGNPLKGYEINYMIGEAKKKAGITKKVTAHTLRHSCATHLIARGANVRYIQELLGHEAVQTTQIYTHIRPVDLQKIYLETHPRCLKQKGKKGAEETED